jgi:predicted nucleic acid-binding protein
MANALVIAERRKLLLSTDLDVAVQRIEQLVSRFIETDTGLVSTRQASSIARTWQLSAYDASYLYLAQRTSMPLATLDEDLALAARRSGIETV